MGLWIPFPRTLTSSLSRVWSLCEMANGARDIIRQTPGLQSQSPSHPRAVALSLRHNATSAFGLPDRVCGKCYILEGGKKIPICTRQFLACWQQTGVLSWPKAHRAVNRSGEDLRVRAVRSGLLVLVITPEVTLTVQSLALVNGCLPARPRCWGRALAFDVALHRRSAVNRYRLCEALEVLLRAEDTPPAPEHSSEVTLRAVCTTRGLKALRPARLSVSTARTLTFFHLITTRGPVRLPNLD